MRQTGSNSSTSSSQSNLSNNCLSPQPIPYPLNNNYHINNHLTYQHRIDPALLSTTNILQHQNMFAAGYPSTVTTTNPENCFFSEPYNTQEIKAESNTLFNHQINTIPSTSTTNLNSINLHRQSTSSVSSLESASPKSSFKVTKNTPKNLQNPPQYVTSTTPTTENPSNHIQKLAQMTQCVGLIKSENTNNLTKNDPTDSSTASASGYGLSGDSGNTSILNPSDPSFQLTAAAFQQYNWQSLYYQQFNAQATTPNGISPFGTWPPSGYGTFPDQRWAFAQTKKGRQTYHRTQTSVLESKFGQSRYVSKKQREELRSLTCLTDRQIKIWFQNRRMKEKKEKYRTDDPNSEQTTLMPANPPPKSDNGSSSNHNGLDDNSTPLSGIVYSNDFTHMLDRSSGSERMMMNSNLINGQNISNVLNQSSHLNDLIDGQEKLKTNNMSSLQTSQNATNMASMWPYPMQTQMLDPTFMSWHIPQMSANATNVHTNPYYNLYQANV